MNNPIQQASTASDDPIQGLYDDTLSDEELAEATHNLVGFVELLIDMDRQYQGRREAQAAQPPLSKSARDFRINTSEDNNQED